MSGVFEIASIVLRYPDDAVLAGREEVAREAEALPDSEATAALRRVTAWWAALADADLRREYSATFDLSRRTPLDLTYLTHGDRRQRGMALLELRQRYLALGFEPPADELPDHLPALLELASEDPEGAHRRRARHGAQAREGGSADGGGRAGALRPARVDAAPEAVHPRTRVRRNCDRRRPVSGLELFLFIVIPYAAITSFVLGHIWRYRRDQYTVTTRSSQILERRWLRPGILLFHLGLLAVIGGHILGLLVPKGFTESLGVTERTW
jgi:nitrate reductase molybdenum cofactor assembly chaperone